MTKNTKKQLVAELESTFYSVDSLTNSFSVSDLIAVSAKYTLYVSVAKSMVYLSLRNKRDGYKIYDLTIDVEGLDDIWFNGYFYQEREEISNRVSEFHAFYSDRKTPQFTESVKDLVNTIPTDFQVDCFLRGLKEFKQKYVTK